MGAAVKAAAWHEQPLRIVVAKADTNALEEEPEGSEHASVVLEDEGEMRARELCGRERITCNEVWEAIQKSSLNPRHTDRAKNVEDNEERLNVWSFGLFVHGGMLRLTTEKCKRPWLTRLLTELVVQNQPAFFFTSITMSINTVFRPHKDRNTLERDSAILGLSKFEGGQLWVEDETGNQRGRGA